MQIQLNKKDICNINIHGFSEVEMKNLEKKYNKEIHSTKEKTVSWISVFIGKRIEVTFFSS